MKLKLFLSHASEDKPIVRRFRARFPDQVEGWLDEKELMLGERFPLSLEAAIREHCDFVLVFLSRAALSSEWVAKELAWALEREAELDPTVPYVVPVLLEPVGDDDDYPAALRDRHRLACLSDSEDELARAVDHLFETLLALLGRYSALNRPSGARHFVEHVQRELAHFQDAAYLLCAVFADPVDVLAGSAQAQRALVDAVDAYARAAAELIPRLPAYAQKVSLRWGRNLGEEAESVLQFIEQDVYRGKLYALNEARNAVNLLEASPERTAELKAAERRKSQLLKQARAALDEMSQRSSLLLTKLRREL
jgi:hypothetical protein